MKSERRIVITGMGALSPIGNDLDTIWQNLEHGKSGIGKITSFDTTCLLYTSPSPRDGATSRMPSSA